ncbi:transcription factor IIF subunit tfg1 [Lithohypha guttulata]|uniref:transcription factor IIF subunit tfg1 n=1 Tax=Lithohypha guttulata TaxID=1690604 RepID=UPI002DE0F3B8|nr:transcription factor IIF subunit tfg1 [Lithohypha guttulata]
MHIEWSRSSNWLSRFRVLDRASSQTVPPRSTPLDMNPTRSNGTAPTAYPLSNGTGPPPRRMVRKKVVNPFATARQPGQMPQLNGQQAQTRTGPPAPTNRPRPIQGTSDPNSTKLSGFSDPAVQAGNRPYTDYKLVVSKKDMLDGLRYHIMQLNGNKVVDIRDPKQFPPPAHLHRRDPRSAPANVPQEEQVDFKDGMTEAERQTMKDRTEQRKLERAANLAQIAPTQVTRKANGGKTKTKAVFKREYTEEEKRRIQTNYEEKLPWHLEDFENKHCFVGQNQGPSARRYIALAHEPAAGSTAGRFRLIPVEKLYEFQLKKRQIHQTIEDAEAQMKRKTQTPEWLEQLEYKSQLRKVVLERERQPTVFTGGSKNNDFAGRTGEDVDLDFDDYDDGDLFADDEEGDTSKIKDEDEALADKRIREDQLKANLFEMKEEADYDKEEEDEIKQEQARKEYGRTYRKGLSKYEHNYNVADSDSEYSSSDEEEDPDVKKQREDKEEERRKELEAGQSLQPDGTKLLAPASGTNTPSGRREKDSLASSDREGGKLKANRKRPGSPNLSDAGSGTDTSTRNKKPKMKHISGERPISRPDSPSGTKLKIRASGAGSDTDAAASDSQARRLKLKHKSSNAPSRTASPAPGAVRTPTASSPAPVRMPSVEDMANVLRQHPEGITVAAFVRLCANHLPNERRKEIIAIAKPILKIVPQADNTKLLFLKDSLPA